jgi:hypothetical protein
LAMDELTNTLFVSFEINPTTGEGGNVIEIVDAITLQNSPAQAIAGVTDLTSIVFDAVRRKLYATDRNTNLLHVLNWNPAQKTVSLENSIHLENIDFACGMVIDGDLLYVSEFYYRVASTMDYYSDVNCYRISENFDFVETIAMGDKTVAIGHDAIGNVLYGGAYAYPDAYQYLIKNPLDDPNGLLQKKIGAGVIDIACDDTIAGRVFLTTERNNGNEGNNRGSIEMWDTANWLPEPNELTVGDVTAIYDETNTDGANMSSLSGILVVETPKSPIQVVKNDNVETSISPEAIDPNVVYTVGVSDPNGQTNLWIVDYLPREVNFVSASPADTNYGYDRETHTYTWFLPSLAGYDPSDPNNDPNVYFTLTAGVNRWLEPMSSFVNRVTAESTVSYGWAAVETNVGCWGGNVIYVDPQATGRNFGTSWKDAYRDLPRALARAAKGCGSEIWVAKGTYRPADTVATETFKIPAGVSVYGGFAGYETSRSQRNIRVNKTTLSGFIALVPNGWGGYNEIRNNIVVTMGGNAAMLDGFTIKEGMDYGIFGNGNSYSIANCVVMNNEEIGIYCNNGNLTLNCCDIYNNGQQGLRHTGSGYLLTVTNCNIHDNQRDGIYIDQSISTILNSLIYQNGFGSTAYDTYYGINLVSPHSGTVIRNNTIVQNVNEGIRRSGGSVPAIKNCILYYNNDQGSQLAGLTPTQVSWSCIPDCNDINNQHNFNDTPGFAYTTVPNNLPVIGNYHLGLNSPCTDAGDSNAYTNESDMDGDSRVYGNKVDIGADEVDCENVYNICDWNADGIVNYAEYLLLSKAWYTVGNSNPNLSDLNYNPVCDLNHDYVVDEVDLIAFVPNWLWIACWRTDFYNPYDFNHDGLVNMYEFKCFADAWLSHPADSSWDYRCDLIADNDNQINLADLTLFLEQAPWLWVADFRWDILERERIVTVPLMSEPSEPNLPAPPPQEPNEPNFIEEPSIEQQIADLQDAIAFLENLWETDETIQQEISAEDWQAFMDALYVQLAELESQLPPEDPNEPFDPNMFMFGMGMMSMGEGMFMESQISNQQEVAELQDSIQFLESLWDDPEFQQEMNVEEWQEFMDSVKSSLLDLQMENATMER